jgi:hypothetical protein
MRLGSGFFVAAFVMGSLVSNARPSDSVGA